MEDMWTVTIICHLCGRRFRARLSVRDTEENYEYLSEGVWSGESADHWCDECERDDQRQITRDWNQ